MHWQAVRIIEPHVPTKTISDPDAHLFSSALGEHLFVVDGSQLYDIDAAVKDKLVTGLGRGESIRQLLSLPAPPPRYMPNTTQKAISLAVSQTCNMGCNYCYAQGGNFGNADTRMAPATARAAIDRLMDQLAPGDRASIAFMGGEPLVNRGVIRLAVEYAHRVGTNKGVRTGFSLTTNGTLLNKEDIDFFNAHQFTVTVSLDGIGDTHDKLRPFKGGRKSYQRIIANCKQLLATPRTCKVLARVTVTPENLTLGETLEALVAMGFDGVGFSPLLHSPNGNLEMNKSTLATFLTEMIACAETFMEHECRGVKYPFSNVQNALAEIHRGTEKLFPCGAGIGYTGVSATGDYYACHRFVEDANGKLGTAVEGVDPLRQAKWMRRRIVENQKECRSCWARYLCGGGCHHEVEARGRFSCDFVRGWLEYCLGLYVRLQTAHPDVLDRLVGNRG